MRVAIYLFGMHGEPVKDYKCNKCGRDIEKGENFIKVRRQGMLCKECFEEWDCLIRSSQNLAELKKALPPEKFLEEEFELSNAGRVEFLVDQLKLLIPLEKVVYSNCDGIDEVCFGDIYKKVKACVEKD